MQVRMLLHLRSFISRVLPDQVSNRNSKWVPGPWKNCHWHVLFSSLGSFALRAWNHSSSLDLVSHLSPECRPAAPILLRPAVLPSVANGVRFGKGLPARSLLGTVRSTSTAGKNPDPTWLECQDSDELLELIAALCLAQHL
jgi:hypothetical protein